MDDERRSLAAALTRTPEVEQFLRGGELKQSSSQQPELPKTTTEKTQQPATKNHPVNTKKPLADETLGEEPPEKLAGRIAPVKKRPVAKPTPASLSRPLVAITTRFQPSTADDLRRASLERKLAGQVPWTQQEIIENAVATWLAQNKKPTK